MINEATLVGNVGNKETKTLKNGGEITVISIATSRKYVDSKGEKQVITTWHNVNCFSKLAEIAAKYVHKGNLVYIKGEINNKKIETGERAGQYNYSITASSIVLLPNGSKKDAESKPGQEKKSSTKQNMNDYSYLDDSIPF